ncbi:probable lathosterol oxidase at C-terminar half [Coccomyxa sp. Obi]|nr:probable lathosterol oxidase at C-terminar half [Coccomyxa sp. Obi]
MTKVLYRAAVCALVGVGLCAALFREEVRNLDAAAIISDEVTVPFTAALFAEQAANATNEIVVDSLSVFSAASWGGRGRSKAKSKEQTLAELREENDWKNDLILFWLPAPVRAKMPRIVHSWLRNYLACMAMYFAVGSMWVYYIYWCFGNVFFGPGKMPGVSDVFEQIKVAMGSMPLYAMLPALTEAVVERGWTRVYTRIDDVGIAWYLVYFVLYMTSVEFFVYWMHRGLHDVKLGYRMFHHTHHKYNKEHTLSPFAGLAFNPFDGILQAIPYCWTLLYIPMHFLTHELLLFATGVWTTNIHDCIHGRADPIMGAGYHTIHHTTYKHNYGHYFVYMDKLFGTLVTPEEYEAEQQAKLKGQ